jgi:hypothetical protein
VTPDDLDHAERGLQPVRDRDAMAHHTRHRLNGPEPEQVVTEECDLAGWFLDLLPGQTRARTAAQLSLERMTRAVAPGRYVVALGYRLAPEGRLHQAIATGNEAIRQATYQGKILAKIRKVLRVETNSEILSKLLAR